MNQGANLAATGLSLLGVIFIMAMAFNIMPTNIALFAGVVCFILAGTVKKLMSPKP